MDSRILSCVTSTLVALFSLAAMVDPARSAIGRNGSHWIGTWAAAPQPFYPKRLETFQNQTLRLIVHTSVGGRKVRIRLSNTYGDHSLLIGGAHIARRRSVAEIDPASDRTLTFHGRPSATVPARSMMVSDPVELDVPALSDLSISIFFPENTQATTTHVLAQQTNYVSPANGNHASDGKFPVAKKIDSWPFLTGVDVEAAVRRAAIVAFGSSLTDGDGTTTDANHRWPDVLAQRLQDRSETKTISVLNEGIIGNRLLRDSPQEPGLPFGASLGQSGLERFDRDVLRQPGVRYVIVGLGINDILMPGSLTPAAEKVSADNLISGYRQLIARAHRRGVRVIGTTNPPAENAFLALSKSGPPITFYTPGKERVRQKVNEWILTSKEFDGVVDFDTVLRDPEHPTQLFPAYDSGDHLHPNDSGCKAEGDAVPLALFTSQ